MSLKRIAIVAAVAGLAAAGFLAYDAYIFDPCEIVVHQSIPSPDQKKMVIIFEAECGATVGFNTQASIASVSVGFSPHRNPSFFSMNGQRQLTVEWKDDKVVTVAVPPGDKVYRKDTRADDVSVEYRD
jgi:hypothetical protein